MHFPSLNDLKARDTRKWTVYDNDVIPLWIAESDFLTAPPVKKAIMEAVERESFGYTPASSDLPSALSEFYAQRFGWRPDPAMIVTAPDVVRGLALAVQYMTRANSSVIVPVPSYPPFLQVAESVGRQRVDVGAYGGLDLAEVEQAFKDGAGSILLASPNNPLGYTYDSQTLQQLCLLADRYGARVLVDEIHAPLMLEGSHVCAASISEVAARVCITLTATSKAWNIAGLKCAQMIFTNPADLHAWNAMTGVAKDGTSTLGIYAAIACYREGAEFLDEQVDFLRQTRDWLLEELPRRIPGIKVTSPKATYLMWLDFTETKLGTDPRPARWIEKNAKVAFNDGYHFGEGGLHHARLNFATSRELLQEALDRLEKAFATL